MPFSQAVSELVSEFIGTFLLCLTIPLAGMGVGTLAAVPIGFMLMAMVFSFGYISGGHFNPAISLSTVFVGKNGVRRMAMYVGVQVLASICANLYGTIIAGLDFPVPTTNNSLIKIWQGFLAELVYTFALTCVVLHVAMSRQKSNEFYGFAIGMTVLAAAFSVGGFTGGAFNPAVATGSQLVRCWTGDCVPLYHVWLYWAAPCLGAFIGALLFNILDTQDNTPAAAQIAAVH